MVAADNDDPRFMPQNTEGRIPKSPDFAERKSLAQLAPRGAWREGKPASKSGHHAVKDLQLLLMNLRQKLVTSVGRNAQRMQRRNLRKFSTDRLMITFFRSSRHYDHFL
jgi:hypothetical protein